MTKVKVGDRVGAGWQRGACRSCDVCAAGREDACARFENLYDPPFGGSFTSITVRRRGARRGAWGATAGAGLEVPRAPAGTIRRRRRCLRRR